MGFATTTEFDSDVTEVAPCLSGGALAEPGWNVVKAAARLGGTRCASLARAWCVAYLFDAMERVFGSDQEPTALLQSALECMTQFLEATVASGFVALSISDDLDRHDALGLEEATGEHYGQLFQAFGAESFWEEPQRLLRTRLERNGIDPARFRGSKVLDAGCGGGRYSVAWRQLGAGHVTGIDISVPGIEDARQRVGSHGIDEIVFQQGSVLDLPFPDGSFDVVFSNGVLHHTTDWQAGVRELVRVLAPGGLGWLYLIERPGGLFWDVIEILRVVMRQESRSAARRALYALGAPANRVFYMLDHVMVPINRRLTSEAVASALVHAAAVDIRRLTRGTDFDRVEQISKQRPFATTKYGVGENRFVFSRE